jgi:hypothetical protein
LSKPETFLQAARRESYEQFGRSLEAVMLYTERRALERSFMGKDARRMVERRLRARAGRIIAAGVAA